MQLSHIISLTIFCLICWIIFLAPRKWICQQSNLNANPVYGMIHGGIFWVLVLPMIFGWAAVVWTNYSHLLKFRTFPVEILLLGGWALAGCGLYWFIKRSRINERTFLIIYCLASIIIRMAYVLTIEPDMVSDFRRMWEASGELVQNPSLFFGGQIPNAYYQRAWPYLFPLRYLFGSSHLAFAIPNVFTVLGTSLLAYWLSRRFFGVRVAQAAALIMLLAPQLTFCCALSSHDIPGAFLMLLSFTLLERAYFYLNQENLVNGIFFSGLAGLALTVLKVQRHTDFFVICALTVLLIKMAVDCYVCRQDKNIIESLASAGKIIVVLGVAPLIIYLCSSYLVGQMGWYGANTKDNLYPNIYAGVTMDTTTGTFGETRQRLLISREIPKAERSKWVTHAVLSEIYYNFPYFVPRLASRSRYGPPLPLSTFYTRGLPRNVRKRQSVVTSSLSLFFVPLCVIGLMRIGYGMKIPDMALIPLLSVAFLSFGTVFCFQVQARYFHPAWYILPMFAAYTIQQMAVSTTYLPTISKFTYVRYISFTAALISTILLAFLVSYHFVPERHLNILSGKVKTNVTPQERKKSMKRITPNKTWLSLQFPRMPKQGDSVSYHKRFHTQPGLKYDLSFNVASSIRPRRVRGTFDFNVLINGAVEKSYDITDWWNSRYIVFKDITARDGQISLDVVLTAMTDCKEEAIWKSATLTITNLRFIPKP